MLQRVVVTWLHGLHVHAAILKATAIAFMLFGTAKHICMNKCPPHSASIACRRQQRRMHLLQSSVHYTIAYWLNCLDVHCTRALLTIIDFELDGLTFCECFKLSLVRNSVLLFQIEGWAGM